MRLVRNFQAEAPLVPARVPLGSSKATLRRPGRRSRALPAAIAAFSVAALAAGCQTSGAGSGAAGSGSSVITVAAIRGVDDAPLYLAAAPNGTFAKAGLNVRIRSYPSVGQELKALQDGTVDVAAGDYADFLYAQSVSRHPDLRIVADGYHAAPGVMEVLASPGSGITSPQGLVGKKVGTPEPQGIPIQSGKPYSLETLATQSVLTNDNVDPQQVTWDPMPAGDLINALADHKVDAVLLQEPYIYQAETRLGAVEVLDSCSGPTANLPLSGYFAVNSFATATAHAQALVEFRSALQQAQANAALPGPVRTVLASGPGMTPQSASLVTIGAYPTTLDAASPERVESLMFNFEMLSTALNVQRMILR